MSNTPDFDISFSKNTLKYIENTLFDYKLKILKDLSENIEVSFKELNQEFLVSEPKKKRYHGKNRMEIDDDLCMARVWHKVLGPVQCSRKKIKNDEDIETNFCKIHQTKQNYGVIDE